MPTTSFSVLFAAGLCAAIAAPTSAQGPASSAVPHPDPALLLAGGGSDRAAPTQPPPNQPSPDEPRPSDLLRDRHTRPQQDPDYSLRAMFQQAHGDFMLARERFDPMIEIGAGTILNGSVSSETGSLDLYTLNADVEVPLTVAPDAYVTVGAFFGGRHYTASNMVGFNDETLYAAGAHFGFGWFLSEDVLLEAKLDPGFWSDWDGTLHHQDFDMPASALATLRYSKDLFFKAGVRYSEVYENANVLPQLGFAWAGESVRVDILLPESLEVSLWPAPDFAVLLGADIRGAEYHVRSSPATGKQRADLRVQEVLLYTGALWRLNDYTSLNCRVGAALAGDYKLDDGDPATRRVTGTFEPSLFFDLTFGIDF